MGRPINIGTKVFVKGTGVGTVVKQFIKDIAPRAGDLAKFLGASLENHNVRSTCYTRYMIRLDDSGQHVLTGRKGMEPVHQHGPRMVPEPSDSFVVGQSAGGGRYLIYPPDHDGKPIAECLDEAWAKMIVNQLNKVPESLLPLDTYEN